MPTTRAARRDTKPGSRARRPTAGQALRKRGQGTRAHGQGTRQRLLEAAGQVFARHGFSLATGKEICRLAGVNAAAVNYHFGGMEGLYEAVLHEVVQRMVDVETLSATVAARTGAREKLRAVIGFFVEAMTGPLAASWEVRVLAREIVLPVSPTLLEQEIGQRVKIIQRVIAEVMERPVDDSAVAFGYVSVMAPCLMLLIADRQRFQRLFPPLKFEPSAREPITGFLVASAYGALRALAGKR